MKKLILISLVILLLIFAGLGSLLPIGFHNFVHQTVLPNLVPKSISTNFIDTGFHQKKTSFKLMDNNPPLSIEIDTISSLNPKNNYINVKVTDLNNNLPLEFEIHPVVTSAGKLKIHFKFKDLEFENEKMNFKLLGSNIYIGDFTLQDLERFETNPTEIYFDKKINFDFKKFDGLISNKKRVIEGLNFELGTKVVGNNLSLNANSNINLANITKDDEDILAKDTTFEFRLGDFNFEKAQAIIKDLPKQFAGGKKPSMFAMFAYIKAIIFPFELKYNGSTKLGDKDKIILNLAAKVKSKHILNLETFGVNVDLQHRKEGMIKILKSLISNRYADSIVGFYALKANQTPQEKFSDRGEIVKLLKLSIEKALSSKEEMLINTALDMKLITLKKDVYRSNIVLDNKMINMNGKSLTFKEMKRIPKSMMRLLFPEFRPGIVDTDKSELAKIISLYQLKILSRGAPNMAPLTK